MQSSLAAIRRPALGALCHLLRAALLLTLLVAAAAGQTGEFAGGQQPPEPVSPTNFPSVFTRVIGTDVWRSSVGGLRNVGSGTINVGGLNGTVTKAYLFWHGVTNTFDPTANSNIQVNDLTVSGTPLGTSYNNNWDYFYSQAYRADITGLVGFNPNRSYLLNGFGNGTFNPNGATLIIFYNDTNSANDYDVTIVNGNDSNVASSFDPSGWDANFGQIYDYNVAGDILTLIVADGQTGRDPAMIIAGRIRTQVLRNAGPTFQGNTVPSANNGPHNNGNLWDLADFNLDPYIEVAPGYNNIRLIMDSPFYSDDDDLSLVAALACVPIGPEQVHITNPRVGGNLENTTQNALLGADVNLTANLYPDGLAGGSFSWSVSGPGGYQFVSPSNSNATTIRFLQTGIYTTSVSYLRNGVTLIASVNVNVVVPTLSNFGANMVDVDQVSRNSLCSGQTFENGKYSLG